ncbi:tyrosine-type recombinase/integrase [Arsenicicoccus piscis]|uniref:Tyrosine recombinase XerC n=1 Tax=Arsenicicoccus piscis TaxID=673954 RepID=A0ABQ6HQS8_9MICO|nr:tyrosine-type recombinase/integrase [Arsenicicoccus piscis]MCH8628518.1 tyrosine-type recombinase/integrase [Arsenicicoccus piscis]GMA19905.1 tyrosine recombinase XerC [Arsenicicoccus piscis]
MAEDLQALGASFARSLKAEGRSERTRLLYGQSIRLYAKWLAAQGHPADLDHLNRDLIRGWLGALLDVNQPGTVKTRYRGLFRFCGWLAAEGEIQANPMIGMTPPQPEAKPVPVLTDDDLSALLRACRGPDFVDVRDEALFRVMLDCGIRVSEASSLTVDDVRLDDEMAFVRGKGSRVRPIYFSARTVQALDRYLRKRRAHRWAHLATLFLSQRGGMSPDGVRDRLDVRAKQAGLGHMHPHQFRHTFAHDFLFNGGQERDLKRLAGWRSDVMLERYGASAADARARAATQRMKRGDRV